METKSVKRTWRVCVTRDEDAGGPLATALRGQGLDPVFCPVLDEAPPEDAGLLAAAASALASYDWAIFASARAVRALREARVGAWPERVCFAAVGPSTARALVEAGATGVLAPQSGEGGEALWEGLKAATSWSGQRVLIPTTRGGRRLLIDRLVEAGAQVDEVEAYRMVPRETGTIANSWRLLAPDAAVIASPRTAEVLSRAIGIEEMRGLQCLVAIGPTTASALKGLGAPYVVADAAAFEQAAAVVARCRDREGCS